MQTGLQAGGADAPYKCFACGENLGGGQFTAPSIEIPKGGATNGSETQKREASIDISVRSKTGRPQVAHQPVSPAIAGRSWKGKVEQRRERSDL